MLNSLVPNGQKTAVQFVFLDTFSTSKEYQRLSYIEAELSAKYCAFQPVLMTDNMASFIRMNCRCVHCKNQISSSLARCTCGKQLSNRIWVEFLKEQHLTAFNDIFHSLCLKVSATRKLANRNNKLMNAGRFTQSQISQLFTAQDALCFYCACSLINEHGEKNYHIDHYVSLQNGGSNEISNLVLACPKCNLQKGADNPLIFIKRINMELEFDRKKKAESIRKKIKSYKKMIE